MKSLSPCSVSPATQVPSLEARVLLVSCVSLEACSMAIQGKTHPLNTMRHHVFCT